MIYYSKRIQIQISKGEKAYGVKSEEKQAQTARSTTHGAHNFPSNKIDNICDVLSTREAHWKLSTWGFYWRLVT